MLYLWKFWVTVNKKSEWGYTNQERQVSPGRLNFVRWRLIVVGPHFGTCPISTFCRLEFSGGAKIFWITCRNLRVYYALFSNWECTKYSLNPRKWLEEERVGVMMLGEGYRSMQRVSSIAVLSTAATTACTGGCRLPLRYSCRARWHDKGNRLRNCYRSI